MTGVAPRVTADEASHRAWRDHPDHRATQLRGRERWYATYSVQVGTTSCASARA